MNNDAMKRTEELQKIFGDNLVSVVQYGSELSGEHTSSFSRENLLVIVKDDRLPALRSIKTGRALPLIFSERRFKESLDVFPIEFADMEARHRVLFGPDPLAGLRVDRADLRRQIEFELRSKYLQLRQMFLESGGKSRTGAELMARSLSGISVLIKSVLRALGETAPAQNKLAWTALAKHCPLDVQTLERIWDIRHRRGPSGKDIEPLFTAYLNTIDVLIEFVERLK